MLINIYNTDRAILCRQDIEIINLVLVSLAVSKM